MRRRILLATGGTLLVMLVIISLASGSILRDSYAALERRYIERDVRRMVGAISREAADLGRTVEDYSAWTAMYRFAQHPSTSPLLSCQEMPTSPAIGRLFSLRSSLFTVVRLSAPG